MTQRDQVHAVPPFVAVDYLKVMKMHKYRPHESDEYVQVVMQQMFLIPSCELLDYSATVTELEYPKPSMQSCHNPNVRLRA